VDQQVNLAQGSRSFDAAARWLVVRRSAHVCAAVVGILDISVGLSYLFQINVTVWYGLTLALKLAVVALLRAPGRLMVLFHFPALAAFALLLVLSSWTANAGVSVWLAAGGFVIHLLLTLAALRRDAVGAYLKAVAFFGLVLAAVYDVMAMMGGIEIRYGRYLFFGGSHPNLGSEIFAMSLVAAAMSFDLRRFAIVAPISLLAVILMQGRAALLVMLLVCLVRILQLVSKSKRVLSFTGLATALALLVVIYIDTSREAVIAMFNSLFMLDDPYRGTGTGFVGRSERWEMAWDAFVEKPIFGQGFGFYATKGIEGAHNFYMYSLVEFGLVSVPIFAYGLWCLVRVRRFDAAIFARFLPISILTVFNDRFINLNPYPFVMIALLLAMSARFPSRGQDSTPLAYGRINERLP